MEQQNSTEKDKLEQSQQQKDNGMNSNQIIEEKFTKDGETIIRKYSRGKPLGKGGFAKCYEITNQDSKAIHAAKIIQKSTLTKARAKQKLISEIKIHKSLNNQNIVHFEHVFEDHENVYILLELCSNQTLNELLKRRKRLLEIEVQCYLNQILLALQYLHKNRVIHRDLKLGNLFLNDKMEIKLGDFGLATRLEFDGEKKRTICGTPNYIAPEILDGKTGHSYEVDIWSLGVILYTLLIGKPPFETPDVKTTYKKIKANQYQFPEHCSLSETAKDIIQKLLVLEPAKRLTIKEIFEHKFLNTTHQIPATLPLFTLACPPNEKLLKQIINTSVDIKTNERCQSQRLFSTQPLVNNQLGTASQKQFNSKAINIDSYVIGQEIYVVKWVDYSSKYGLGYLLSNNASGVCYNDSTKIILNPEGNIFEYYEKRKNDDVEIIYTYSIKEYPKELQKKITLLEYFKGYLLDELKNDEIKSEQINKNSCPYIYIKKWMKNRNSILFRLSNKVIQVDFADKTELIMSPESKIIIYTNKLGEKTVHPLSKSLENPNKEMAKRIRYTKNLVTSIIDSKPMIATSQRNKIPQQQQQYIPQANINIQEQDPDDNICEK